MMVNPRVVRYLKQVMGVGLLCVEARGNIITVEEVRMAPAR